jgi:hypothetical protein
MLMYIFDKVLRDDKQQAKQQPRAAEPAPAAKVQDRVPEPPSGHERRIGDRGREDDSRRRAENGTRGPVRAVDAVEPAPRAAKALEHKARERALLAAS